MVNPTINDMKAIFYGTSVPILKAAVASGSPSNPGMGDGFLRALSYLAAYDMADNYLRSVFSLYEAQLNTLKNVTTKAKYVDAVQKLEDRISKQRVLLDGLRLTHANELSKFTAVQDQIDRMNQQLRATAAMNFASNFNFGR